MTVCTADVDECAVNNGGCQHSCQNLFGSFMCTCPAGQRLAADRTTCKRINMTLLLNFC